MEEYIAILMNTYNNKDLEDFYNGSRVEPSFSDFIDYPHRFFIVSTKDRKGSWCTEELIVYKFGDKYVLVDFVYGTWENTLAKLSYDLEKEDPVYKEYHDTEPSQELRFQIAGQKPIVLKSAASKEKEYESKFKSEIVKRCQKETIENLITENSQIFDTIEEIIKYIKGQHSYYDYNMCPNLSTTEPLSEEDFDDEDSVSAYMKKTSRSQIFCCKKKCEICKGSGQEKKECSLVKNRLKELEKYKW